MELQSRLDEIEAAGAAVWAISGDDPAKLRSFRDRSGIGFDFLLDPGGETFASYGILNERHDRTVPHPTVVVVDAQGIARYLVSDADYKVRPPAEEIVAAVRALTPPPAD